MKWLLKLLVCSVNRQGVCIHVLVKQNRINEALHPKYSKDTEIESFHPFLWLKNVTIITIRRITTVAVDFSPSSHKLSVFPACFSQETFCVWRVIRWKVTDLLILVSWALVHGCSHPVCNRGCIVAFLQQRNHRDVWVRAAEFLGSSKRKVKDETEQGKVI